MTFETITIKNHKGVVQVFDGDQLIHSGTRPVDHAFAQTVYNQAVDGGYTPVREGNVTKFTKK